MKLISQLQEAADLPLEKVVPAMKKDKRVSQIFKKLEPDDVDDWKTLIATLKYYFFNNQNVVRYLDSSKEQSEYLSSRSFRYLRSRLHKNEVLDKYDLELIRNMVNALPKELEKDVQPQARSGLHKAIEDWLGGKYGAHMKPWAASVFASFPSIRPTKPIVVYRGIRFDERDLSEEPDYHGHMTVGSGVKFLRTVRQGKRIADVEWSEFTNWTRDPKRAKKEALGAYHDEETKVQRGKLGFVISMLADPEDIVVDSGMLPSEYKYVPPDVVVIKPGKYVIRLVKRFTRDGEEDVLQTNTALEGELEELEEMLTLLDSVIKLPYDKPQLAGDGISGHTDIELYKQLIQPEAAEKIDKVVDTVHNVFNQQLKHIDPSELAKMTGGRVGKVAAAVKALHNLFTGKIAKSKPAFRGDQREYEARHLLPAATARLTNGFSGSSGLRSIGSSTARFRDWSSSQPLINFSHMLKVPVVKDAHMRGHKDQQNWLGEIISSYSDQVRDVPQDNKEGSRAMAADADLFMQNAKQLDYLSKVKTILAQLEG